MQRSSNIFWGLVLLVLGGLFLVDSLGIVSINLWGVLWPLLLILFGLWVLLGYFYKGKPAVGEPDSISLEGARSAGLHFHHGAGRLVVGAGAGPMDLVSGTFAGGLNCRTRKQGDHLDATLRVRDANFPVVVFPGVWGSQRGFEWLVKLSDEIPLDLKFNLGASETHLELTDLQVRSLRLDTGASATEIDLPDSVPQSQVVVKGGLASVKINVPEGVAARIRVTGGLMDARVDRARFPRSGGYYQSPDYDTAPYKVDLRVDMGLGSVNIH
jgi:hypothetical protein